MWDNATQPEPRVLLLVIDDALRRSQLRAHLAQQGFLVHGAGDARTALRWLERREAAVVIADVLLPGSRIAIPHVLRRRHRVTPLLIGLAADAAQCRQLEAVLSFDRVLHHNVPVAVLTREVLRLLADRPRPLTVGDVPDMPRMIPMQTDGGAH